MEDLISSHLIVCLIVSSKYAPKEAQERGAKGAHTRAVGIFNYLTKTQQRSFSSWIVAGIIPLVRKLPDKGLWDRQELTPHSHFNGRSAQKGQLRVMTAGAL